MTSEKPARTAAGNPAAPAAAPRNLEMVVGGEHVPAVDGETFDVVSPVDGRVIARVPKGGAEDVDRAVKAAQRAFDGEWHNWSQTRRGQTLARFASLIRDHLEELAVSRAGTWASPSPRPAGRSAPWLTSWSTTAGPQTS